MTKHPLTPNGITYALLDTNALIPPRLSDMLFDCAAHGMFLPRWTKKIEEEFVENWGDVVFNVQLRAKKERKAAKISPLAAHVEGAQKRLARYRAAVGVTEWEIFGYDEQDVIDRVPKCVDTGDIHLAAAGLIQLDALSEEPGEHRVFVLSANLKHLSVTALKTLGIEVVKPGKFIDLLCKARPSLLEQSLRKTVSDLNDYSQEKLLLSLSVHGAAETVKYFSREWAIRI